jgi:hypothetical protein
LQKRLRSGRNRQRRRTPFRFEMRVEQVPRLLLATAAAGGATRTRLQLLEAGRTLRYRAADVLIGNGLADTNVHGGHFEKGHSTVAI